MSKVNFIRNYVKKNLLKATDEGIMTIPNTQKVDFQEGILRQLLIEQGINPDAIKSEGAMNEAMAFINQSQKTKATPVATNAKIFDLEGRRLDPDKPIMGGSQDESIKKNIAAATAKGDFTGIANQVLRDPEIARGFLMSKKFPFSRDENVRSGADAIPLARKAEFDEEMGIKKMAKEREIDYNVEKIVSDFKKYGNATDKDIQTMMKSGKMGQIPYVMDNYGMSYTEVLDTIKRGDPLIEGLAKGGRAGFKAGLFSGRRTFLKTLVGNTEKNRKNRQLQKLIEEYRELQKSMEKNPQFKFPKKGDPEFDDTMLDVESKLAKDRLKSATGGRIGFAQGLGARFMKFLSDNSPLQAAKKYNKSVKDRMQAGKELEVASEVIPIAASGALVTNQLKKMLKNMNEEQKKEQQDKMFKEFSQEYKEKYKDSPELLEKMLLDLHKNIYMEEKADGGRIGYKDGPKFDIQASGSKSGKQQIPGAPKGITMDSETLDAIISADIPISQKIDLLGKFQYGKGRTRIEKDGQELFLGEGGSKSRDIGLGFNKDGEGFGATLMYNMETGKPEIKLRLLKRFAEGGRIGLKDGMDRRTFMKIMGGLATLPIIGKFLKPAKTAKVAKDVSKVVPSTQPPPYFFSLAEKIKLLGKESKVKPQERVNEYYYTGKNGDEYTLTEDIGTGDIQIIKDKTGVGTSGEKSFDVINDRTVMDYKKGRGDESTKGTPADEYDEYKVEFDQDGTMAGADEINEITKKEIVDEVSDNIPSIKKASGGLARMLGE